MKIISWLGTVQPEGLNNVLHLISAACALSFRALPSNDQCCEPRFQVFTLKGFARNVCDFSGDDTLPYFYLINFHFLLIFYLHLSVTHRQGEQFLSLWSS